MRVKKILTLVLILVAIVSFSGLFTVAIAQVCPHKTFQLQPQNSQKQ